MLTEANQADIIRLCRLVNGMPLGLEMAATWLPVLTCAEIVAEIERDLDFLATSAWNVPERHRSMRAVFESSWNLLSDPEKNALKRLSVFQGGFQREAAAQVASATLPLLLGLLNKSLLRRNAAGRYDLHELIRQYAAEKLAEQPTTVPAQYTQHALYYLNLAEQAAPELRGPDQLTWLITLETENDNLRAALAWLIENQDTEKSMRLGLALGWFWLMRGHITEGRNWLDQVLALPAVQDKPALHAKTLHTAGLLTYYHARYTVTQALLEQSAAISETIDDRATLAHTLFWLGNTYWYQHKHDKARLFLEKSLALCTELADQAGVAAALTRLGVIASFHGDHDIALSLNERSVAIYKTLGNKWGITYALCSLAEATIYKQHDYDTARSLFEQSLSIAREVRDKISAASAIFGLADLALAREDHHQAEAYAREGLTLAQELGDIWQPPRMLRILGHVALHHGHETQAVPLFIESLNENYKINDTRGVIAALVALALTATRQKQFENAARWLSASQTALTKTNLELLPMDIKIYEQTLAAVQAGLPTQQLTSIWTQAQQLTLEEAIQAALTTYQAHLPGS
jgi:tetratricopeptide (TPR) repeat protein